MGKGFWRGVRWTAAALCAVVLIPVASEFFIELARARGFYRDPIGTVDAVLSFVQSITAHPAFPWSAGILFGFTVGIWLDTLVRKAPQKAAPVSSLTDHEIGEFAKADPPLMEPENITPQIRSLLESIAQLCDMLKEPVWDETDRENARIMFLDIKQAKTDVFYNEPAYGVLRSLIQLFDIALVLKADAPSSSESFTKFEETIHGATMLFARLVGMPVRYRRVESTDNQSQRDTGQKTQP